MNSIEQYSIDHVAHAVEDLESALHEYEKNFGMKPIHREAREDHGVEIVFLDTGASKVELIAPLSPTSALTEFLRSHGPGLHHICYRVNNIQAELERLESLGHKLIDRTPREGAMGTIIAFVHPRSMGGVLVELCQYVDEKASHS